MSPEPKAVGCERLWEEQASSVGPRAALAEALGVNFHADVSRVVHREVSHL